MNIFIEGPQWAGMWTEVVRDALQALGNRTSVYYHTRKTAVARVSKRVNRLMQFFTSGKSLLADWATVSNQRLLEAIHGGQWNILLSIQGKLDAETISILRDWYPDLKIVFWWGDILTDLGKQRILELYDHVDHILVSYKGDYEAFKEHGLQNIHYLPFGVSRNYHVIRSLTPQDKRRYYAPVSFVGTYYPERCEVIRFLNEKLDHPVRVWGRSWRRCKGIAAKGTLPIQEALKVYACSDINLNIHHRVTNNGFNMKYYEIPAVKGFQICDWQPAMMDSPTGRYTVDYRTPQELLEKIRYFLRHEDERHNIALNTHESVQTHDLYELRLASMLSKLI